MPPRQVRRPRRRGACQLRCWGRQLPAGEALAVARRRLIRWRRRAPSPCLSAPLPPTHPRPPPDATTHSCPPFNATRPMDKHTAGPCIGGCDARPRGGRPHVTVPLCCTAAGDPVGDTRAHQGCWSGPAGVSTAMECTSPYIGQGTLVRNAGLDGRRRNTPRATFSARKHNQPLMDRPGRRSRVEGEPTDA